MATIEGSKNWCLNPSAEVDLTSISGNDGTRTRDSAQAWVGSYSVKVDCAAGLTTFPGIIFTTADISSEGLVDVAVNTAVRLRITASQTVSNIITRIHYTDATWTDSVPITGTTGTGNWVTIRNRSVTSDSAKTISRVEIQCYQNNPSSAVIYWADGADIRIDGHLDTYIDGDQGSLYTWSGTASNSASTRADVSAGESTGTGGIIKMVAKLYRTNRNADRLEDISDDIIEGAVTFDMDAEIKMSFVGKINNITQVTAYEDFVMPVLQLTYADESTVEEPLGNYLLVPAQRRYTYTSTEGDLDGRGAEWLLSIDEFSKGYRIEDGADFITEVVSILHDMGLNNVNIPLSGKRVPKKRRWKMQTKKIEVVNALLDAAGYVPIFTGRDGSLRSFKRPNIHKTQPAVIYDAAGLGSELVGTISETPDMENFANRFVVVAEDAQRNTIRAIARNDNEASPVSIPRLGFIKTRTHISRNINNATDAMELAKRMLERAARHLVKLEIETLPDPARNPYEIYTIRARQEDGTYVAFGNYACTGWTIGFTPQQGSMKHKVERLEIYE